MFRKIALGLIAATSLILAAAAPASAGGFHHHHWGHHWGWGPTIGVGFGGVYVDTAVNGCLQQSWIETRRGMRLRTVNVCAD
jgi:hypothetical protein